MAQVKIAPSILAADFSHLKDQIKLAEQGGADWLHLDVMDGRFVPNITFGPMVVETIRRHTKLPLDTHLMIDSPEQHLEAFRSAGSDIITVHEEACMHLQRTVARIRELGAKAGVAINPSTPTAMLRDIVGDVDLILIMSVNPGFGGQSFITHSTEKLKQVKEMVRESGKDVVIEIDGGIDPDTAPLAVRAGADVLVAGTSIFRQPDIPKAILRLRKSFS